MFLLWLIKQQRGGKEGISEAIGAYTMKYSFQMAGCRQMARSTVSNSHV